MRKFKKTAVAAAISAGVVAAAGTAQAYVIGPVGEALLVPLVTYSDQSPVPVNTLMLVEVPSFVGQDDVPNKFTAPHVSAAGGPQFGTTCSAGSQNKDTGEIFLVDTPCDLIHWYFFDYTSKHMLNQTLLVTPDDKLLFDWRSSIEEKGREDLDGVIGYLVFTTDASARGEAANFAMAGDAFLTVGFDHAWIPVLPMTDGNDAQEPGPSPDNNCVTGGNNIPKCSPIVAGTRLANADGDGADRVYVDVELFPREYLKPEQGRAIQAENILVTWLDQNYGLIGPPDRAREYQALAVNVFDEDERACSDTIPLPFELNITLVTTFTDDTPGVLLTPPWVKTDQLGRQVPVPPITVKNLCTPNANTFGRGRFGFVRFNLPEGLDVPGQVASSGVFFNLVFTIQSDSFGSGFTTLLGHDLGKEDL